MVFPVVIHQEPNSDFGVTVPDLPGCFSAGSTPEEAMTMAREAIELHLEGMAAEGQPIPVPRSIDFYRSQPDFAEGFWALIRVEPDAPGVPSAPAA